MASVVSLTKTLDQEISSLLAGQFDPIGAITAIKGAFGDRCPGLKVFREKDGVLRAQWEDGGGVHIVLPPDCDQGGGCGCP